jgi:hypothetical protein
MKNSPKSSVSRFSDDLKDTHGAADDAAAVDPASPVHAANRRGQSRAGAE